MLDALGQHQAVGQTCERVAVGQLLDTLLRRMLCRKVAHEANALHDGPTVVAQGNPRQVHCAGLPHGTRQVQFALPETLALPAGEHLGLDIRAGTGIKQGGCGLAAEGYAPPPHQALAPGVHAHEAVLTIGNKDGIQARLKNPRGQAQSRLNLGLVSDVAKGEYPAYRQATAKLRHAATLHNQAGAQGQDVCALMHGIAGNRLEPLAVQCGVRHLLCHMLLYRSIVTVHEQFARHAPQRGQALVESAHTTIHAAYQQAVGGRIQRGAQL